jgi:hypothetical protein
MRKGLRGGLVWLALAVIGAVGAQQLPELRHKPEPPEQPIPFSHKLHASNGVACKTCHPIPDPGDFAEIAGTATCMGCHQAIKPDAPAIQKLKEFHDKGDPVPWEPVYLTKEYVFFSHRVHVEKAGAQCGDCHGPVEQREVLSKERDISMQACMDCHRATKASIECNSCHELR